MTKASDTSLIRISGLQVIRLQASLIFEAGIILHEVMIFGSFKRSAEVLDFALKRPEKWMFSYYVRVFEESGLANPCCNGP